MKSKSFDILLQTKKMMDIPDVVCNRTSVTNPTSFLNWLPSARGNKINMGDFRVLQPWMLTAIAVLSRKEVDNGIFPVCEAGRQTAQFANGLGLLRVLEGDAEASYQEEGRTVKLHRINSYAKIDDLAEKIAQLAIEEDVCPDAYIDRQETAFTLKYILIELLRNVIQHSGDPNGGVVVAQRMDFGEDYSREKAIQICVADLGCGIFESLKHMHPDITDNKTALERALWPSLSGTFPKGEAGSSQNAGMGLFFISEMVKRLAGRMLIASADNSLLLQGSCEEGEANKIEFRDGGFPGTLIVVDIPKRSVADYDALFSNIRETAIERSISKKKISFIKFDSVPNNALTVKLSIANENTAEAEDFSNKYFIPNVERGVPLCLDFSGFKIMTQSFLHAVLFKTLKLAYEKQVQIYAKNLTPAVKDCLLLLEWYTLGKE